jgi:hypothetical protein
MARFTRLLALLGAAGGAAWIINARGRALRLAQPLEQVLGHDVREFLTHRVNPAVLFLGLAGGRRSVWGVLEHVGRETGKTYHTPVMPLEHEEHIYIPLTYGNDVPLVKNVRAAGHCRLQVHEMVLDLDEPMVVGPGEPIVPAWIRPFLGNRRYLRLHVLDVAPGTLLYPREAVEEQAPALAKGMVMIHPEVEAPEAAISAS